MNRAFQFCTNANTLYRLSAWGATPFDENIRTAEDKEWLKDVMQQGHNVAVIPAARTMNVNQYSLRYMVRKGYSDATAEPDKTPMSLWGLFIGWGSQVKRFFFDGKPLGNAIRGGALILGQFFGSRQASDNRPWSK